MYALLYVATCKKPEGPLLLIINEMKWQWDDNYHIHHEKQTVDQKGEYFLPRRFGYVLFSALVTTSQPQITRPYDIAFFARGKSVFHAHSSE